MNPQQPQEPQAPAQQQPMQPQAAPQGQDPTAQLDAKIEALTQKMDMFGKLTIQAIMELEAAIEDRTGQKVEGLKDELSVLQSKLSAIIEE